jgi:sugar-specific transcriptional regulator TrmB
MLENVLKSLNFDPDDIKTYLLLLETGPITAGILAKKLGSPRASVYGYLERLKKRGLVNESLKFKTKLFIAEAPEKITLLFNQQKELLEKSQKEFTILLPTLKNAGEKFISPKFQIFENVEGLRQALKDMLLYYNLETYAFWPQRKMVEVLSGDFFRYHNKERIKNNLSVQAIWPENQTVEIKNHPYFGSGKEFKREIKIAPKEIDFTMGYWIYGNKTVFISSQKESFGFILESVEFAQMLKAQFKVMWQMSKTLAINPDDVKSFVTELAKD